MAATLHDAHVNMMYLNVFSGLSRLLSAPKTNENLRNILQSAFYAAMLQTRDTFDNHARKELFTAEAMSKHLECLCEELEQGSKRRRLIVDFGEGLEKSLEIFLIPQYEVWDSVKIDTVKNVGFLFPRIKWGN